jgi:hypothetical protein
MCDIPEQLTSEELVPWWEPWPIISTGSPFISSGSQSIGSSSISLEAESFGDLNGGGGSGTAELYPYDVLLGRGKKHHTHPGNACFAGKLHLSCGGGCCVTMVVSSVLTFFVLLASMATQNW